MPKTALTFEAIDRHVAKADLRQFQRGGTKHFTAAAVAASPANVLQKLCAIWGIVGPIVRAIIATPFIPKKWREALKTLADLLDTVCKGT